MSKKKVKECPFQIMRNDPFPLFSQKYYQCPFKQVEGHDEKDIWYSMPCGSVIEIEECEYYKKARQKEVNNNG